LPLRAEELVLPDDEIALALCLERFKTLTLERTTRPRPSSSRKRNRFALQPGYIAAFAGFTPLSLNR